MAAPHHLLDRLSPHPSISLALSLFLLTIVVPPTAQAAATADQIRTPFEVVWNYPDYPCTSRSIDLDVSSYGIVKNPNGAFVGLNMATLYTNQEVNGLWPYLANNDVNRPVHGGIPQLVNMTAHLNKMLGGILPRIGPASHGYGVIDMEMWKPFLDLNWGEAKAYALASDALVMQEHPEYLPNEVRPAAKEAFDKSARELMEKSIQALQEARPNMHWGYYGYPYKWGENTPYANYRLEWLYRAVNGYYPSIYIKHVEDITLATMEQKISGILAESFNMKSRYGRPDAIMAAYTCVQNSDYFFTEDELYYAIGLPADMGLDAVILWSSSNLFSSTPWYTCSDIKNYVRNTLGPFVEKLTARLTNCSATRCMGQGRCVRKDYAQTYPDILGPHTNVGRSARAADPDKLDKSSGKLSLDSVDLQQRNTNVQATVGLDDANPNAFPTTVFPENPADVITISSTPHNSSADAGTQTPQDTVFYTGQSPSSTSQPASILNVLGLDFSIKTEQSSTTEIPMDNIHTIEEVASQQRPDKGSSNSSNAAYLHVPGTPNPLKDHQSSKPTIKIDIVPLTSPAGLTSQPKPTTTVPTLTSSTHADTTTGVTHLDVSSTTNNPNSPQTSGQTYQEMPTTTSSIPATTASDTPEPHVLSTSHSSIPSQTSTTLPPSTTTTEPPYQDYMCQCYPGWTGPSCEFQVDA